MYTLFVMAWSVVPTMGTPSALHRSYHALTVSRLSTSSATCTSPTWFFFGGSASWPVLKIAMSWW